jgi:hypothetical protein
MAYGVGSTAFTCAATTGTYRDLSACLGCEARHNARGVDPPVELWVCLAQLIGHGGPILLALY